MYDNLHFFTGDDPPAVGDVAVCGYVATGRTIRMRGPGIHVSMVCKDCQSWSYMNWAKMLIKAGLQAMRASIVEAKFGSRELGPDILPMLREINDLTNQIARVQNAR